MALPNGTYTHSVATLSRMNKPIYPSKPVPGDKVAVLSTSAGLPAGPAGPPTRPAAAPPSPEAARSPPPAPDTTAADRRTPHHDQLSDHQDQIGQPTGDVTRYPEPESPAGGDMPGQSIHSGHIGHSRGSGSALQYFP